MTARVLVVDDILSNVKLLEAKLTAEYFEVITAFNGVECLAKMNARTVAVKATLQTAKADPDPHVQQAAEAALVVLNAETTAKVIPAPMTAPVQ